MWKNHKTHKSSGYNWLHQLVSTYECAGIPKYTTHKLVDIALASGSEWSARNKWVYSLCCVLYFSSTLSLLCSCTLLLCGYTITRLPDYPPVYSASTLSAVFLYVVVQTHHLLIKRRTAFRLVAAPMAPFYLVSLICVTWPPFFPPF